MTQAHPTSGAEPEVDCPVSLEVLGSVYRADEFDLPLILEQIPPIKRAQLAAYLYGKSHMHKLGLQVARSCERDDPIKVAGEIGSVIHGQAHLKPSRPVPEAAPQLRAKTPPGQKKVSLAGAPAKPAISLGGSAKVRNFD